MPALRPAALALALALLAPSIAGAQQASPPPPPPADTAKNTVFVEGLGNAVIYSVNYERFLSPRFAIRVGAGYLGGTGTDSETASLVLFPVMGTYLLGEGSHHLELGAGVLIASAGTDLDELGHVDGVAATGTLGYRYQKPEGGFVFRIGFTPVKIVDRFLPWGGISLGYAF